MEREGPKEGAETEKLSWRLSTRGSRPSHHNVGSFFPPLSGLSLLRDYVPGFVADGFSHVKY